MNVLFSEIYGCYYQVAAAILTACQEAQSRQSISRIAEAQGFGESALFMLPKLFSAQWPLLEAEGDHFRAKVAPEPLPLSLLERRFLAAAALDKRMGLFLDEAERVALEQIIGGAEPLFRPADFLITDQSLDGDDYDDVGYRLRFRQIAAAIGEKRLLCVAMGDNRKYLLPQRLEYSAKDDRFRLHGLGYRKGKPKAMVIVNLGRVTDVRSLDRVVEEIDWDNWLARERAQAPIVLEIFNERNALERVMLHFAKYEKHTEYDEAAGRWRSEIYYAAKDETELLIQLLSFGPVIRVLGPEKILRQIRERLAAQKERQLLAAK